MKKIVINTTKDILSDSDEFIRISEERFSSENSSFSSPTEISYKKN